jgi:calcineurin-like phosphoesterase family protein
MPTDTPYQLPDTGAANPWIKLDLAPDTTQQFTFAVLSDRTGLARPGVFERAIDVTNLLRPDFVVQVGDQIEGYTEDAAELEAQWKEFDAITDELAVPYFRVPGNHDVSNELMRQEWVRRHGALHYSFRYRDVLFVVLNTQDPPQRMEDFNSNPAAYELFTEFTGLGHDEMMRRLTEDLELAQRFVEAATDWEGKMPANFSDEQVDWARATIAANADARWTFLLMHMPAWQVDAAGNPDPQFARIIEAFGDRPYTALCGHVHNYQRREIGGREHIRLGPTGGLWVKSGEDGNFDHVMLVTVTTDGPVIANVVLDGVLGAEGGVFAATPRFARSAGS